MLKALVKKQFAEIFKGYYVNRKNGKAQSRGKTVGLFILFAVIMLSLGLMFFGMAYALGSPLIKVGISWLYFAIMGTVSLALGIFGSVFNTYASLYKAKDNDLLLSMPIPPHTLLTAKIISVIGLSLLYGGIVWIPSVTVYFIFGHPSALSIVFSLLLTVMLTLLITAVTCALGFVVAIIAGKIKNKSMISAILTVLFIGTYYYVYFRFTNLMTNIVSYSTQIANGVKKYGNFLYQLGIAASGNISGMLIFSLISVAAFVLCFFVLSKSFLKLSTKNIGQKKAVYKKTASKQNGITLTLYKRELKHFVSVPIYLLNCGLSIVLLPAAGIFVLIKSNTVFNTINQISESSPIINDIIALIIAVIICLGISMDGIAAPSVSLEGKTLWLIKSLPITTEQIFNAKLALHISLNIVPAIISAILFFISFKTDIFTSAVVLLFICSFLLLSATIDLLVGVFYPNLNWTSETAPVKQSLSVFLAIFSGIIIMGLVCLGYYLLHKRLELTDWLITFSVIMIVAEGLLKKILYTKGVKAFEKL